MDKIIKSSFILVRYDTPKILFVYDTPKILFVKWRMRRAAEEKRFFRFQLILRRGGGFMRASVRGVACAEPARAPRFEEKSGAFGRLRALCAAFVKAAENPPFHAASVKPRRAAAREVGGGALRNVRRAARAFVICARFI